MEGLFPASTQIPTLYAFIRAHLAPKYVKTPFTIYQSPPKRDLLEKGDVKLQDKTIKDLGMAPQAIINIRWSEADMNGNTYKAPLNASVLSQAQELPIPPSFDSMASSVSGEEKGKTLGSSSEGVKKVRPNVQRASLKINSNLYSSYCYRACLNG